MARRPNRPDSATHDDDEVGERAIRFAEDVERARKIPKGPDLFWRRAPQLPGGVDGEICFLRRWNSHTPMYAGGWGGGYFLRWRDKGTVIDPGCTFLRAFASRTEYSVADIHAIIATHDHADHCHDLVPMISLLREFNKWRLDEGMPPHGWDLVLSHGAYSQYQSLVHHPENSIFLTVRKILPPKKADQVRELPDYLEKPKTTKNWLPHQRSFCAFHRRRRLSREYGYRLAVTPAWHRELLGDHTGFGVTLELLAEDRKTPCRVLAFSGDTAIRPRERGVKVQDFRAAWKKANLLVLHVGTMEKPKGPRGDLPRVPEHLGFRGVREILGALRHSPLEMVVLAEWGYEFGRLGLRGRTEFCQLVQQALEADGCDRYYSITRGQAERGRVPIVPCDMGLRVSLPRLAIWCGGRYISPHEVVAREDGERVLYEKRS